MLPYRRSFLVAFFSLLLSICHAAHSKSTNTNSSTFTPSQPTLPNITSPTTITLPSTSPSQTFTSSIDTSSNPITVSTSGTVTSPTTAITSSTSYYTTTNSTTPSETPTVSTSSSSRQTSTGNASTSSPPLSPSPYDVNPGTTLTVSDAASLTTSSSSDDAGPTDGASSSSATSSTPFWHNTSAVAGTFITAGLASVVLVAGTAYIVMRRRQRKRERELEAEDFSSQGDGGDPHVTRGASPAPSMAQVTTPTRTEAYVSRDVHFGTNYMDFAGQGTYGLDYPPAVVPPHNAGTAGWNSTYPYAPTLPSVGPSAVENTYHLSHNRQTPGRDSLATHFSADSFYGGIEKSYGEAI